MDILLNLAEIIFMLNNNLVLEKSYAFSLRIIKLYSFLKENRIERALLMQLLKAGTSIGANIEEAVGAQSRSDFIHKLSIAYKEARETSYWLRLFRDSGFMENKLCNSFIKESEELKRLLAAILLTSKKKTIQ